MLEQELAEKLKTIFKVRKVSFDEPGPMAEQECLFIEVESCRLQFSGNLARSRVMGKATYLAQAEKAPLGYFAKQIDLARSELTKDFFFYDFEQNTRRFVNIVERTTSFVYFSSSQFDPENNKITDINLEES